MCLGEARGERLEAQVGVAWVVRNRVVSPVKWWGKTYLNVILKRWQFSAFNHGDPNREKMASIPPTSKDKAVRQARWVAWGVIRGDLKDPTKGATHYHDTSIKPPEWTKKMKKTVQLGRLIFYRRAA